MKKKKNRKVFKILLKSTYLNTFRGKYLIMYLKQNRYWNIQIQYFRNIQGCDYQFPIRTRICRQSK